MNTQSLLEEKNVLIVDDEDDIPDTLEGLLPMRNIVTIGNKSSSRSHNFMVLMTSLRPHLSDKILTVFTE